MNVTIEKPNKAVLDNSDVITCLSTGAPAPSMHWTIIRGQTTVWRLGSEPQLVIGQLCMYKLLMWPSYGNLSSLTVRCAATRLNYTAYSDVKLRLGDAEADRISCGVYFYSGSSIPK